MFSHITFSYCTLLLNHRICYQSHLSYTPSSDYSRTAWGGRIGLQPSSVVGKEGFFRVANCGGRSYLLDPDNGAVIIHGIQHVRPGESTAHKKAFAS